LYPESDNIGVHQLQVFIVELLRPLLERWLRSLGRVAHAGADQFWYFQEGNPRATRAPDVYVIDGVPQDIPEVGCWKTWEGRHPCFALEVCGDDWHKDYDDAPADYDAMGADEVIIFDPGATARSRRRVRWQVYRRTTLGLVRVAIEHGDRVYSRALGCFLRRVDAQGHVRLRLAIGDRGDDLFPTEAEAGHAAWEAEHAARETERSAREAAEVEVLRLRAELARLRGA
jgi:hypothetical protein